MNEIKVYERVRRECKKINEKKMKQNEKTDKNERKWMINKINKWMWK